MPPSPRPTSSASQGAQAGLQARPKAATALSQGSGVESEVSDGFKTPALPAHGHAGSVAKSGGSKKGAGRRGRGGDEDGDYVDSDVPSSEDDTDDE